jgi:hypothetical protein
VEILGGVLDPEKKTKAKKQTSICYSNKITLPIHLQFLSDIKPKS